jgi:hypothetical protein
LSGAKAVAVCHALLPFLCLKRRQAEILIAVHEEITRERYKELGPSQDAFYTTGKRRVRRYMISDTSMARRRAWLEEIRLLNDTRYPVHQVSKVTA